MKTSSESSRSASTAESWHFGNAQHERIMQALVELVAEQGYAVTTVSDIVRHAKVPKSDFYRHFQKKDECALVAFDEITARLEGTIEKAGEQEADWPHTVKAGIEAMLRFLAAEPSYARFCIVEALSSTSRVLARYEEVMVPRITPFLEGNRIDCSAERLAALPSSIRETIAGGILWILFQRIRMGEAEALEELSVELVEFTLAPYLGDEARSVALETSYDSGSLGGTLEHLLHNADEIRARHQPRGDLSAAELIREGRER